LPDLPRRKAGKPRKYHILISRPRVSAEAVLAGGKWQKVSWRRGTKGRLTCLFAARRVRVADAISTAMLDNRMQCMPGDEVWLVGERRSTGEQKYYVSNLPADASLKMLAATIKARWVCEQAHQQLKEELGSITSKVDPGPVTPTRLMTMIAYAFLQSRRLKAAGRKKKSRGTAATTEHAGHQASHPRPLRTASTRAMPHCEKLIADAVEPNCQVVLGSGLIDHSQKMTNAAMQIADMKVWAHRS